jgi:hypothetical protein
VEVAIRRTTSATDVLAAPAWIWWKLDLASPTGPANRSSFAPGGGEVKYSLVEGHAFLGNPNADYTASTLVDMSSGPDPVPGAMLHGFPSGVINFH